MEIKNHALSDIQIKASMESREKNNVDSNSESKPDFYYQIQYIIKYFTSTIRLTHLIKKTYQIIDFLFFLISKPIKIYLYDNSKLTNNKTTIFGACKTQKTDQKQTNTKKSITFTVNSVVMVETLKEGLVATKK